VAKALGTYPENTRLFLNGLAACDLVIKKKVSIRTDPMMGRDIALDQGEIADAMLRAGLESVRLHMLGSDGLKHR